MGNFLWDDMNVVNIKFDIHCTRLFLDFICMGNIIVGINVIYVLFNMVPNKACLFEKKLPRIPVLR